VTDNQKTDDNDKYLSRNIIEKVKHRNNEDSLRSELTLSEPYFKRVGRTPALFFKRVSVCLSLVPLNTENINGQFIILACSIFTHAHVHIEKFL
jgi:hypothetical protein